MFADVEVISNNTYGYNQFTYSIPHKFKTKLSIGSFVKVEFRNKIVDALVVNLKSKTEIKNPKDILKVSNFTLDNEQDLYCKYIALSNRLNCGILLHNIIDLDNLRKQNILKTKSVSNINFQEFNNFKFVNDNVFFVSSIKQANELSKNLKNKLKIDFYQKFGGKDELINVLNNKKYRNIIILSNNFEKVILNDHTNYFFYDSNSPAYKLPKLNNLNIVESSYLKNHIFGGKFIYINEFPNLEFNDFYKFNIEEINYGIEYYFSNNLKDNLELLNHKYPNKVFKVYSKETFPENKNISQHDDINNKEVNTVIISNPTISSKGLLNSYKLISLLRTLNFCIKNNLKIIIFNNKKLNIESSLNSSSLTKWANKELETRLKYGPNKLLKVFQFELQQKLEDSNELVLGPIKTESGFKYEVQIKLSKDVNYIKFINLFKSLNKIDLTRVRYI